MHRDYGLINDYGAVLRIKLSPQGNGFFLSQQIINLPKPKV
ncbi:hypothetical protein SAMN05216516_110113 [Izhakiella capsodis]|uniref:Uncharacterized protein n=2 Tax=Izhakiella capsodis TaxID=1367852 RepID=A0A1I5A2K2_9GAMM|nr:hypothetical protein SAMN05216516_110113 [Izhakiella capsodis]